MCFAPIPAPLKLYQCFPRRQLPGPLIEGTFYIEACGDPYAVHQRKEKCLIEATIYNKCPLNVLLYISLCVENSRRALVWKAV